MVTSFTLLLEFFPVRDFNTHIPGITCSCISPVNHSCSLPVDMITESDGTLAISSIGSAFISIPFGILQRQPCAISEIDIILHLKVLRLIVCADGKVQDTAPFHRLQNAPAEEIDNIDCCLKTELTDERLMIIVGLLVLSIVILSSSLVCTYLQHSCWKITFSI